MIWKHGPVLSYAEVGTVVGVRHPGLVEIPLVRINVAQTWRHVHLAMWDF